ncbi:hypothetical protein CEXT_108881, partial [Caerostris extrusa]
TEKGCEHSSVRKDFIGVYRRGRKTPSSRVELSCRPADRRFRLECRQFVNEWSRQPFLEVMFGHIRVQQQKSLIRCYDSGGVF